LVSALRRVAVLFAGPGTRAGYNCGQWESGGMHLDHFGVPIGPKEYGSDYGHFDFSLLLLGYYSLWFIVYYKL
jgi:hypothetical protein